MDSKEYLYSIYIINRSGSLLFSRSFEETENKISSNDQLTLASTFHAMHAITATGIAPTPETISTKAVTEDTPPILPDPVLSPEKYPIQPINGISSIDAKHFKLHCYQTLSGYKFIATCSPSYPDPTQVLKQVYSLFTDYVLKNPFYEIGMPIRCELFDKHLGKAIVSSVVVKY